MTTNDAITSSQQLVTFGRTDVRKTIATVLLAKRCPSKAVHTRLHFINDTNHNRKFMLQVSAPNAELSPVFYFVDADHQWFTFQPKHAGCGHGVWKIEIYEYIDNRFVPVNRHCTELNGAGNVYMRIDAQLQVHIDERLSSDYRRNCVDFNCRSNGGCKTRLQSIAANLTNISLLLKFFIRPEKYLIMEDRALCWTQYINNN